MSATKRRWKVLLVDDDADLVERMRQLLEDDFDLLSTFDWAEVNKIIFREGVDLVLMDVNLPVLKGDKLVSVIRSVSEKAELKPRIVYFSAEDETTMARLVRDTGADGYLSKSLRSHELVKGIQIFLKR